LSYVPLTVNSIKRKLEALNAQLAVHLAVEADKIDNLWERGDYLYKRWDDKLWSAAANKYVIDTKFPLLDPTASRWNSVKRFDMPVTELASKFNIAIKGFTKHRGTTKCQALKADLSRLVVGGDAVYNWQIRAEMDRFFVFNDTKVGALERAKFHWRNRQTAGYTEVVYVMDPVDRTLPMKQAEFLAEIMNPPADHVMMASALTAKERASGMGRNVSILRLENRNRGWRYSDTVVWTDAGKAEDYDSKATHYYIPLSGYKSLGKVDDIKALREYLLKSGVYTDHIYGVRKGDIDAVKTMKNWVPLDTLVESKLAALGNDHVMSIVKQAIDFHATFHWSLKNLVPATSPYMVFVSRFNGVKEADGTATSNLQALCRLYKVATATTIDPTTMINKTEAEKQAILDRYPLLKSVGRYSTEAEVIADYINMVDTVKTEVIQNS
jgi:hypothetical protein